MIESISALIIPAVLLLVGLLFTSRRRDYFKAFTEGALDGMKSAAGLLPVMLLLMVALSMFSASGAVGMLTEWLTPVGKITGIPAELLPLLITRPVSGSASFATYADLITKYGADSFAGLCASVIMGSSDTILYVCAVYFAGAKGVKHTRHALPVSFVIMLLCIFLSCFLCRVLFA